MWQTIVSLINPLSLIEKVYSIFVRIFVKPQLEIYYDPSETYFKANDLSFGGILGLYCHVMVRNKGRKTALACAGELRNIKELQNGEFRKASGYRNIMRLKWAHEKDFSPKDVDVDTPRRLDVCYVHDGHDVLHFFTEKYPSGNQTDFPPGKYKVKVRVKGENAAAVEKEFVIQYKASEFDSLKIGDCLK